jgi:hypothetical protein
MEAVLSHSNIMFATRIYFALKANPEKAMEEYPKGCVNTFNNLLGNDEHWIKEVCKRKSMEATTCILRSIIDDFDGDLWISIYGKVIINAHGLSVDSGSCVGALISVIMSSFNHSCRPNTCLVEHFGPKLSAIAVDNIQPGDQLTISYVSTSEPREVRRAKLKSRWCLECECIRCLTNEDDLFKELDGLEIEMKHARNVSAMNKRTLLEYFDVKLKIFRLKQKMMGKFDPSLTTDLWSLINLCIRARSPFFDVGKPMIELLKELKQHIRTLHPVGSTRLHKLKRCCYFDKIERVMADLDLV